MKRIQTACVVGARPNFVKMAALLGEFRRRPSFDPVLIHTGQHFSAEMSEMIFQDLEMPDPDVHLGVASGTQTEQTADIMRGLERVFTDRRPDVVVVVGDVNSTVAAALVAAKLGIAIAHVEAGLRSFDRSMPEEINRLVTDVLSDFLFASERSGVENLRREGISEQKVFLVGNVMIDTLLRFREKAARSDVIRRLGLQPGGYGVVTLHRPSNVDDATRLNALAGVLTDIAHRLPLVFPVHPRTRQRLNAERLTSEGLVITPPLGYLDFLHLLGSARLVLTDSGGIQEETTILEVPCITLRENTERPITVEQGTNVLAGVEPEGIRRHAFEILAGGARRNGRPELWDGRTSARIAGILERAFTPA